MEITLEKSARVKKEEGAGFQSLKSKSNIGGAFICFLVSVLLFYPVWSFYMVLLKCVELKYIAFNLPCARFILFVICGAACLLIMRYRAF